MSTDTAPSPASSPPAAEPGGVSGRHLTLEVTGMTCASCVRRVERALAAVPGVAAATVNLAAESADITLARPVEAGALITAVADAGYQAAVPAIVRADSVARRRAAQAAELRGRRVRLGAGAVLSAAVLVVAYGFAWFWRCRYTHGWAPCSTAARWKRPGTAPPTWTPWSRWARAWRSAIRRSRRSPCRAGRPITMSQR